MLDIREKKLRQELRKAQARLERRPDISWYELEPVARLLHWLGDPEAAVYFRRAAEDRVRRFRDPEGLLATGNCYRLAGDEKEARRYLEQAYSELKKSVPGALSGSPALAHLLDCGYLLGRYEEVVYINRLKGSHRPIARLAEACLKGDARAAAAVAHGLAEQIRETRVSPGSSRFGLDYWDRYELALQAVEELGGAEAATEKPAATEDAAAAEPVQRRSFTREQVVEVLEEAVETDEQVDFSDADLSGVDLSEIATLHALFVGADLSASSLAGSDFRESDFTGAMLRGADLSRAWLKDAYLSEADISHANLREVDLVGAVLLDAKLEGADLSGAELRVTNLQGANLRGTKLTGAEFQDTDFSGADLSGADLAGVDVRDSEFVKARLRDANFSGANLSDADFTETDLTGADLRGANLDGADFEGAIMEGVLR